MIIKFESSQQQDINETSFTHLDETRENGSDSNFIFEKLKRSISITPTQSESTEIQDQMPLQEETLQYRLIEIFIAV